MISFLKMFVLLSCALLLPACGGDKEGAGGPSGAPVVVGEATRSDMPVEVGTVGLIEPLQSVTIVPQVTGNLLEVKFQEGQQVKAGDLLFVIDPAPYEARLREAQATLERHKVEAGSAELKKKRYSALVGKDYVSQQQFDDVNAAAQAALAAVRAAQAAVEQAKLDLSYCTIHSPIDGLAGDVLVKRGNLVRGNDAQSALVRVNQLKPVLARFTLAETYLPDVLTGKRGGGVTVEAKVPGANNLAAVGELHFVDNAVDRSTGTFLLKAILANEDGLLWPGQFLDIVVKLGIHKNTVTVPSEGVLVGQQGPYVFVVKEDLTADLRPVKTGVESSGRTEILSGLREGEKVVVDGQVRLSPGAKVEIKNPAGPAQGAPAAK